METFKKKHTEIIALYKLEKNFQDIYVEGYSDKVFLDVYLKNKKCNKKAIPIEIIDFSEIKEDYLEGLDIRSNKNKVIILSKLLDEKIPLTKVRCVVDKDFDDYIKTIENQKLFRTDFSCLESYLFCEEVIEKFLEIGIGNFPVKASVVISEISKVLKPLFCLRLFRELNYKSAQLVSIDGNLAIDRQTSKINFNEHEYLKKFISKNNLTRDSSTIIENYNNLKNKLDMEIRHNMNGHDFLDIFFLYINKIKNTAKYKEENIGKTLFLTVETAMIEKHQLLQKIIS